MPSLSANNRLLGFPDDLPTLPLRAVPSFADAVLMGYALRGPTADQVFHDAPVGSGLLTPTALRPRVPLPRIEPDPGPPFCKLQRRGAWSTFPLECEQPPLPLPPSSPYLPDYLRPDPRQWPPRPMRRPDDF
jgi:hypothetical protein